jgi:hypothetical protein
MGSTWLDLGGQQTTPYGVFCIVYKGKLLAERPVSGTRFKNIMSKLC